MTSFEYAIFWNHRRPHSAFLGSKKLSPSPILHVIILLGSYLSLLIVSSKVLPYNPQVSLKLFKLLFVNLGTQLRVIFPEHVFGSLNKKGRLYFTLKELIFTTDIRLLTFLLYILPPHVSIEFFVLGVSYLLTNLFLENSFLPVCRLFVMLWLDYCIIVYIKSQPQLNYYVWFTQSFILIFFYLEVP